MDPNGLQRADFQSPADAHAAAPSAPQQPLGRTADEVKLDVSPVAQCGRPAKTIYGAKQTDDVSCFPTPTDNVTDFPEQPVRNNQRSTGSLAHRVTTDSGDVDEEVKNLVSFTGCESLLRGSSLSVIMRDQASIFSDREGTAADYDLSKPTNFIDAYISHNWVVSRWLKFLCLSLHFNLRIAMGLTFLVVSPLGVLAAYDWVPTDQPDFAPYPRSYVFKLIMAPVFLFALFFCRSIVRCCPSWSPIVFLDKTCIHQEDKAIQRQGIEKMGGFLCHSKTMVICYSDVYITKLWTVYEVASFIALQSVDQLRIIPVMYPVVFMFSGLSIWAGGVFGLLPELLLGFYYTVHCFLFVFCYVIMLVFRRWGRSKIDFSGKVSKFSVRNCMCQYEEDRPLVYANIGALMREVQGISKDASDNEALDCFDNFVRDNLSGALVSSVGAYGIRYEHAAAVSCLMCASIVFDQVVGLAHGQPLRELCSYALWYAMFAGFIIPGSFMTFSTWAGLCMQIVGWREHLYLALGLVLCFAPITLVRPALDLLELWANESDIGLVVFALLAVISSAMTHKAMNSSLCPKRCSKKASDAKQRLATC